VSDWCLTPKLAIFHGESRLNSMILW